MAMLRRHVLVAPPPVQMPQRSGQFHDAGLPETGRRFSFHERDGRADRGGLHEQVIDQPVRVESFSAR
jgi:hypothetical protein